MRYSPGKLSVLFKTTLPACGIRGVLTQQMTGLMCHVQQEIVDETDIFEDVNAGVRRGGQRVDVANFLAMFEHKLNHLQVIFSSSQQQIFRNGQNVPDSSAMRMTGWLILRLLSS